MLKMGNSVHLNFCGNCDLLFHLLRCPARPLRDDLHPRVRNVRVRLHRKSFERNDPPNEKRQRHGQNDEPVVQRKGDDRTDHYCSTRFWNSSAFVTTCCPTDIPESTICICPASMSPARTSTRRNFLSPAGT